MEHIEHEQWQLCLTTDNRRGPYSDQGFAHKNFWHVSDCGRIKVTNNYNDRTHYPKIHVTGGHDRPYACLSINNAPSKYIHRLVALFFIPNPFSLKTVNHIDGNQLNNHYSNLEWCSNRDNIIHGIETRRTARKHTSQVEYEQMDLERQRHQPRAEKYDLVWSLWLKDKTRKQIVELTGIPPGTVSSIVSWHKKRLNN